jgi:acyl-CoA thioester hydrolase
LQSIKSKPIAKRLAPSLLFAILRVSKTMQKSWPSAPTVHFFPVRVYYEDTDFSGTVYHASYLRFLERGRTEFLRALDIQQAGMAFNFAVRSMSLDYRRPAVMDDALDIETTLLKIGGASIEMAQQILRKSEILLAANVRIAAVANGRATRIPKPILAKLESVLKI